tara:strand:+ start:27 stop:161 length:135 start_codon:yes stop_codon:yes gene_type:complete
MTEKINLRLSKEDKELLKGIAKKERMSVSAYARNKMFKTIINLK